MFVFTILGCVNKSLQTNKGEFIQQDEILTLLGISNYDVQSTNDSSLLKRVPLYKEYMFTLRTFGVGSTYDVFLLTNEGDSVYVSVSYFKKSVHDPRLMYDYYYNSDSTLNIDVQLENRISKVKLLSEFFEGGVIKSDFYSFKYYNLEGFYTKAIYKKNPNIIDSFIYTYNKVFKKKEHYVYENLVFGNSNTKEIISIGLLRLDNSTIELNMVGDLNHIKIK